MTTIQGWERSIMAPSVDWRREYRLRLADGLSHQQAATFADLHCAKRDIPREVVGK